MVNEPHIRVVIRLIKRDHSSKGLFANKSICIKRMAHESHVVIRNISLYNSLASAVSNNIRVRNMVESLISYLSTLITKSAKARAIGRTTRAKNTAVAATREPCNITRISSAFIMIGVNRHSPCDKRELIVSCQHHVCCMMLPSKIFARWLSTRNECESSEVRLSNPTTAMVKIVNCASTSYAWSSCWAKRTNVRLTC